jgi:hypothetical protein
MAASGFGGGETFRLSAAAGAGALKLHKGDITRWSVDGATDAIVRGSDTSHDPILVCLLHAVLFVYDLSLGRWPACLPAVDLRCGAPTQLR